MVKLSEIEAAINKKDFPEAVQLQDIWSADRGISVSLNIEAMRYIETLEAAIDEARRWCTPFLQEVEPMRLGGAFFKGTVTPTAKAVLALNIERILNKAKHEREEAR